MRNELWIEGDSLFISQILFLSSVFYLFHPGCGNFHTRGGIGVINVQFNIFFVQSNVKITPHFPSQKIFSRKYRCFL